MLYISFDELETWKFRIALPNKLTFSWCVDFRDDYRDETIRTYKEWLRRQDYLPDICNLFSLFLQSNLYYLRKPELYILMLSFNNAVSYLEDDDIEFGKPLDEESTTSNPSPQKESPSHARRKKRKGNGVLCVLQHFTTSSPLLHFFHHQYIIIFSSVI